MFTFDSEKKMYISCFIKYFIL